MRERFAEAPVTFTPSWSIQISFVTIQMRLETTINKACNPKLGCVAGSRLGLDDPLNITCTRCQPGTYSADDNSDVCTPCKAGMHLAPFLRVS